MACVIAAPASGSGKTLLSLCLIAWARQLELSIQPFKVGPDYLDPQLLSLAATRPCRNLDLPLCGEEWVQLSFNGYGGRCDLALVEGVMGLCGCRRAGPLTRGPGSRIQRSRTTPQPGWRGAESCQQPQAS